MLRLHWRPQRYAYAADEGQPAVAPRDAGWAELWSTDGKTRYGRGHLMIWPADAGDAEDSASQTEVDDVSVQPLGEEGPNLRAELRSFTADAAAPEVGADLMVRPEKQQSSYSVRVRAVTEEEKHGLVELEWPDDELPAALTELGGY